MRVCNTCDNTGVVKLHNWCSGGLREVGCTACHQASPEEIKAAFDRAVEAEHAKQIRNVVKAAFVSSVEVANAAKIRADEDRKDSIRDEERSRNRRKD
jgi:hypothetical protein